MAQSERAGHRERIRKRFVENGPDVFSDNDLLELYLSLIIPRKDVKPYVYALIKSFGSLEGVFNASLEDLKSVDGIGENVAVVTKLVNQISNCVYDVKVGIGTDVSSSVMQRAMVETLMNDAKGEQTLIVALNIEKRILDYRYFDLNPVRCKGDRVKILEMLLNANATNFVVAHFDENGNGEIGPEELNDMLDLRDLFFNIGIYLTDWVEMSKQKVTMASRCPEHKLMLR